MGKDTGRLPVIIGVGMLFAVAIGMGGIAYSFYRTEIAQEQEESLDMTNDDSPFEQLKKEKNMIITPVHEPEGGAAGIDSNAQGIPTGTYSNPPATVNSTGTQSSTEANRPMNNLSSSVEENRLNQERFSDDIPDYSRPSSSNNFNNTSDNSLIEPLDQSNILEAPADESDRSTETSVSPLERSAF